MCSVTGGKENEIAKYSCKYPKSDSPVKWSGSMFQLDEKLEIGEEEQTNCFFSNIYFFI